MIWMVLVVRRSARAIELLQNTDFKVRVLAMPGRAKIQMIMCVIMGGQAFKELVAKAVKPLDYLLSESLIKHDTNDTEGKQAVMADVLPIYCKYRIVKHREMML